MKEEILDFAQEETEGTEGLAHWAFALRAAYPDFEVGNVRLIDPPFSLFAPVRFFNSDFAQEEREGTEELAR